MKLPRTLDIMQGVFSSHSLELNWKPPKTECVLHMVERGTKLAGKQLKDLPSNVRHRVPTTCEETHERQVPELQNKCSFFAPWCVGQISYTGSRHGLSQLSRKGGYSKHSK